MRELFVLLAHYWTTLELCRPGGLCAVAAESLAVKHQLNHGSVSASCAQIDTVG